MNISIGRELYHTGVRDYEDNAERFLFFLQGGGRAAGVHAVSGGRGALP